MPLLLARLKFFYLFRLAKFLAILTIEAFAASAFGMAVGAIAKDEDAALALGPPLMTIFILFSGRQTWAVRSKNRCYHVCCRHL